VLLVKNETTNDISPFLYIGYAFFSQPSLRSVHCDAHNGSQSLLLRIVAVMWTSNIYFSNIWEICLMRILVSLLFHNDKHFLCYNKRLCCQPTACNNYIKLQLGKVECGIWLCSIRSPLFGLRQSLIGGMIHSPSPKLGVSGSHKNSSSAMLEGVISCPTLFFPHKLQPKCNRMQPYGWLLWGEYPISRAVQWLGLKCLRLWSGGDQGT